MTVFISSKVSVQKISPFLNEPISEEILQNSVLRTIQVLRDNSATVGFAESCTGGLLSCSLAKVPGVSDIFMGSLVTYANYIKADILNVKAETLEKYGAVSAECAKEMSENALLLLKVKYAVSITGIAGPQGGSLKKPVGTVFISVSGISDAHENSQSDSTISTEVFQHDLTSLSTREEIQLAAALMANRDLQNFIGNKKY